MIKTYLMNDSTSIILDDGRRIEKGCGEFQADLDPGREAWFLSIGAIAIKPEGNKKKASLTEEHHGDQR